MEVSTPRFCNGRRQCTERGFTLFTVVVFTFLVLISGMAYFAVASYETKGALYRQDSSESFYLADGAVERARAHFLTDRSWRDGWTAEAAGRGEYDLAVTDTTYEGDDAVYLLAEGRTGKGTRRVAVMADVPPTAFDLTMLIMGNADIGGNLCLEGGAHVNGDTERMNITCDGTYTEGFVITPPPIYTDPDHFPNATYYFVEGNPGGGSVPVHARIYDRNLTDITTSLNDSLTNVISWNNGLKTFTYDFNSETKLTAAFHDATGLFKRDVAAGDIAVVVNFGERIANPPDRKSKVQLGHGGGTTVIHTTIINTRFTGVSVEDRLEEPNWFGGDTEFKRITIEPYYGIAAITKKAFQPGGSHATIGTAAYPALLYVTGNASGLNSNFNLRGSVICLGSWDSTGGPNIIYDEGFLENLPDYLIDEWPSGVSGTLKVLFWRELAAGS